MSGFILHNMLQGAMIQVYESSYISETFSALKHIKLFNIFLTEFNLYDIQRG